MAFESEAAPTQMVKSPEKNETEPQQVVALPSSSVNWKTCHQCRQKTKEFCAACKNQKKNKQCPIQYCRKCLLNRYGEKAEEVDALADWKCPKCRDICNCSVCMKKKGHQPTGALIKTARETGFSSVSEMLLKGSQCVNSENAVAIMTASATEENSSDGQGEANLSDDSGKESEKDEEEEIMTENAQVSSNQPAADFQPIVPLPVGTEVNTVAGIDVPAKAVGDALQFLQFCAAFGQVLEVKKGQPEYVIEDLFHGRTGRPGKFSVTVQFFIRLLYILLRELGQRCAELRPSSGENSWFDALKKCFFRTKSIIKVQSLECLDKASDYESLEASEKLKLLNFLCDELLGTEKLRSWMDTQISELAEKVKEARQNVAAAKDKKKTSKEKMIEDVANAIIARNGATLSISEHEAIVSNTKKDLEEAHAKVLELQDILIKNLRVCDALRTEPLLVGHGGNAYWKLNCLGNSIVLHQDVGKGDTLTLNEKWFAIDNEGEEAVEKYIFSLRGKKRRRF